LWWLLWLLFFRLPTSGAAPAGDAVNPPPGFAPDFDLPRWATEERVRLNDFHGQLLVLDFFAYWCAPCEVASKQLEEGVQQFYVRQGGNRQGVPVRVLSVNIESERPENTAAFLKRTGASLAAQDASARLLSAFGQAGIPFLVIIDGSASTAASPNFPVVYQHAGFAGVRELRRIIDSLGNRRANARPLPPELAASPPAPGLPLQQTAEAETEWAWTSDVLLSDSQLRYEQIRGGTEWDAAFGYASYDMEYRPNRLVDFFGFDEDLHEDRFSLAGNLRQSLGAASDWTLLVSANGRLGYPNYRRVWIANRYRQKYDHPDFPRVPPYTEPSPSAWTGSLGARWEYLPTVGFAEFRPGYSHEVTAPGYEDGTNSLGDYRLIQNRVNLDTFSFDLSSENILTRRLRAQNTFSFSQTTGRDPRYGYRGAVNWAVSERWVLRGTGGYATEAPQFESYYFGLTAEYELRPDLLLSLAGRYYADTGEIENSLGITSAAPPLQSWEAGMGLRYRRGNFSVLAYGGPFWTDYHRKPNIGPEFIYLYSDRNWGLAQLAVSLQF
jgi:thiol-disulfide isomerase/thioredoxin